MVATNIFMDPLSSKEDYIGIPIWNVIIANSEAENLEEMDDDSIVADLEEDPLAKSMQQSISTPSPKSDDEDIYDIFGSYLDETFLQRNPEDLAKFPHHIKLKEDIGIEDVVKKQALPFLPAKSLCRFRTVSKEWNRWIISPFLAHMQTRCFKDISGLFCQFPGESSSFISLDPDAYGIPSPSLNFLPGPVDIRTICNGLLCCQSCIGDNAYYVCNPLTKEWRMLPEPILYHGSETAIALAFEPSVFNFAAHYELICAVTLPDNPVLRFEIYSSRSNSWRICDTICCDMGALPMKGDGFYMRGVVYWETQSGAVLAFDVKNEDYGILNLPPCSGPTGALTEIRGELCYLLPCKQDDSYIIEVYGNMDMSLKFVIPVNFQVVGNTYGLFRALPFVNDDTLIIILGGNMIAYHARSLKAKWLSNARIDGYATYLPYVNSLVPVGQPLLRGQDNVYE